MEVWLAGGFLPLLLLAWLPAGLARQISAPVDELVGLDLVLPVLAPDRLEQHHRGGTASRPEESVISMECRFKICSENLKVYMKCYKPAHLEESETNTMALEIDCTNLISLSICAAKMGNCVCGAYVTGMNSTDSGNGTQWTIPILSVGFNFPLCITFGLVLGTLLYMPIIGLLLWQCRKNRKGKLASRQVVEGNELSMAAPVTGTEDLTYADLKFEKKGTKSASSNVIYTQIKPPRQKQRGEDAGAADAGVDASPKAEGK